VDEAGRSTIPKFLAASGHKGIVYRDPYSVTLVICPFNGPLVLSLRPAATALSAGNPCVFKLSHAIPATEEALLELLIPLPARNPVAQALRTLYVE
jgi:aldehyde dehydrogenase (NAD+)